MPKRLTLIIGMVLAVAAVILVKVYLDQRDEELKKQAKQAIARERQNSTPVLVAKRDITRGTTIEPDMLEAAIIPNDYVQSGVVTSTDSIVGMKAVVDIPQNQQITRNMLIMSKEETASGGSLAMSVPIGKRAVTVSLDTLASVGGMIRPGDYVDVIALIQVPVQTLDGKNTTQLTSVPLFQNVLVLAVGQDIGLAASAKPKSRYEKKEEPKQEASPLITLALSPQEVNLMSFILDQGGVLRMVLRSPADSQFQPVPPASWDMLLQYLTPPQSIQQTKQKPPEEEPKRKVEIYHGTKKEEIYLPNK